MSLQTLGIEVGLGSLGFGWSTNYRLLEYEQNKALGYIMVPSLGVPRIMEHG